MTPPDPWDRRLRHGWSLRLYHGRHHIQSYRVKHFVTGLVMRLAVHLPRR